MGRLFFCTHPGQILSIVAVAVIIVVAFGVIVVPMTVVVVVVVGFGVSVIAMVLVLTIMIAVIVANFVVVFVAVELSLPTYVAAPVSVFAAPGERAVIAVVGIEVVVDVAVKAYRSAEPGSRANEYAARKPLRAVIAEGRALVRRVVEIAIRADRCNSDADRDLRSGSLRGHCEEESSKSG